MFIIPDKSWNEIKNLIPGKVGQAGRPRWDARLTLSGILYVMVTGAQWNKLPDYYGKISTVHGWFRRWAITGVFARILEHSIDIAIAAHGEPQAFFTDTASAKAPFAKFGGKNPTDRAKRGIKKGLVIDWNRIIFSVIVAPAHRHDSQLLQPHFEHLRRFLSTPKVMGADSAWDSAQLRREAAKINLALFAASNVRRATAKRKLRPGGRWRIEQIFGIQQWNRGIKSCWSKTKESFLALCQFASAIHNFRLARVFG